MTEKEEKHLIFLRHCLACTTCQSARRYLVEVMERTFYKKEQFACPILDVRLCPIGIATLGDLLS